jgi:hypothetical protein
MIRHVVMWRLKDEAKRSGKIENIDAIQRTVDALRLNVPGIVRVGINVANLTDAADLLLYSEFESWEALRGYETHPLHDELRGLVGPLRVERRVLDCEDSAVDNRQLV